MTLELDLDGPEARVPTRLVDRPRKRAAMPPASIEGDILFVVGPFSVTRGLIRAPGAWIVEAQDPNGMQVLLQLVHLRPLKSDAEKAERTHVEQTVLARTTALLDEQDRIVLAHGGVDRVDGTRVLFWAMPVPEHAGRLSNPLKYLDGLDHLLSAGMDIARRMAARHDIGRFEPLLSEHLFLIDESGAQLVGVPVSVPIDWLASDMPSPRVAPEEAANGTSTIRGDVWRLGQALSVLACAFEPLPPEVRQIFERMTAQSSTVRQPRASELSVELDAVRRTLEGAIYNPEAQATVAMTVALSRDAVTELMMRAMAESTRVEAQVPVMIEDAPVPAWAFFFEPEEFRVFEATMEEVVPRSLNEIERAELARLCRGQPSDRWALLMRTFLSIEPDTLYGSGQADPTLTTAPLSFEEDTLIPAATIVEPAFDPSDVAETRTTSPLVFVPDPIPTPLGSQESSVEVALPQIEAVEVPEPVRSRRRWVLGSLGGLALLGAAALAAGRPGDAAVLMDLDRAVTIESGTPNAMIVGEDGTVLGSGPVTIAVPKNTEVAVLVTAVDHRPERIVLPSGGMLRVSLGPLSPRPKSCGLDLASGVSVEGIGTELHAGLVRESAVVRARKGDASRASIVHCDGAMRVDAPSAVQVAVTAQDPDLLLDGAKLTSGARIASGFHRVTSKGRERWVSIVRSVDLR